MVMVLLLGEAADHLVLHHRLEVAKLHLVVGAAKLHLVVGAAKLHLVVEVVDHRLEVVAKTGVLTAQAVVVVVANFQ